MSVIIDGTSGITSPNLDLTSGQLAVADGGTGVSTSTGTGATVRAVSPALTTPDLGTPSALVGTNITGTSNALVAGIGVNQTWTDVTTSRTAGTTYTNSTGKPIQVLVTISVSTQTFYFYINNVAAARIGNNGYIDYAPFSVIIPNGVTYKVDGGVLTWWELR